MTKLTKRIGLLLLGALAGLLLLVGFGSTLQAAPPAPSGHAQADRPAQAGYTGPNVITKQFPVRNNSKPMGSGIVSTVSNPQPARQLQLLTPPSKLLPHAPTDFRGPWGITAGPDGNLWFTERDGNAIGRITPGGAITEYPVPTQNRNPWDITAGPDGNLWFTESFPNGNAIGRITPGGAITEYPVPTQNSDPHGITAGPDGNLWFTERGGAAIGRITPGGAITEYPLLPYGNYPYSITAGPDGNLWFTQLNSAAIGRITPGGAITEYPVPTYGGLYGITAGPDGNLWFDEYNSAAIGRITPGGAITEYPLPTQASYPYGITAGPDGNLWFTEVDGIKIGRITPGGAITEYPLPTQASYPYGITAGPDGNLWFTENNGNAIGRITTAGVITEYPLGAPPTPTPSPIPSLCSGVPPSNPPSRVVIVLPGIHTHLDQPIDYYPVPVPSPGSHYAVSSYCFPPDVHTPQVINDVLNMFNNPAPFSGQSLTNQLAAQGAVILPFSYEGAYFLASSSSVDPLFHVNSWTEVNSSNTSIDIEAKVVEDEVKTVHRVWPNAAITLVGHSNGGLSAEQYWEKYGQFNFEGVSHIFTLDSPINGVRRVVPICWQGLCWAVGPTTAVDYLLLWHTIAFRDPDLAAHAGSTLRTVGTSTDFVYNLPDLPTSPLQSQILHSCSGWPLQPCVPYPNPPNFTSPCRFRSLNWLDSHGFVLRCPEVIDNIMSEVAPQDGPHSAIPSGPTIPLDTPSGQMSPQQVSPGQAATITGQGFGTSTGQVQFTAGNDLADAGITSWTDTQIGITVPMTATTGPVIVAVPSYGAIVVAGATVLDSDNGVAAISAAPGALALWGQPLTLTVTTRDSGGQPLPYRLVGVSDGITDTVQQTGSDGTALFPIQGYDTQDFVVHSGSVYTSTTLTWSQPPTMTLAMTASDVVPPDGEPITISATLRDEAGQPVPNQPVDFTPVGSDNLRLTPAQAWTDSSGVATTSITNTGSEHFLVGAVANVNTTSAYISIRPIVVPSLVGHMTWQGRPAQPSSLQQLPLTLTLTLGPSETDYPAINTTASGVFTASVSGLLTGTYTWRVKGPKYLANSGTINLTGAPTTNLEMGLMRAGDANNDNLVSSVDFTILKNTFGLSTGQPGYDDRADFNGDLVVNVSDFNLLRANFGSGGAAPTGAGRR